MTHHQANVSSPPSYVMIDSVNSTDPEEVLKRVTASYTQKIRQRYDHERKLVDDEYKKRMADIDIEEKHELENFYLRATSAIQSLENNNNNNSRNNITSYLLPNWMWMRR